MGLPVLRALSLCTCCRHYPGAAEGRTPSLVSAHPYQPSPEGVPGRPAHRPFRGLLSVHSRCGPHTRAGHQFVTRYPKASDISSPPCLLRLLPAGAMLPGGACTHWKAPPCHGAVESGCGAVAVARTYLFSAPFVWRCLTGSDLAPFPHPAHRTGHADLPHPALGQDLTPSPTTGRAQAGSDVRARSARRGARVDTSRLGVA